jgi:hypothetical protein
LSRRHPPPTGLSDCNCSFCSRPAALLAYYPPSQFKLTTAPENVHTDQAGGNQRPQTPPLLDWSCLPVEHQNGREDW